MGSKFRKDGVSEKHVYCCSLAVTAKVYEEPMRLVTLLQSDHRDEQTWPNQQKDKDARIREAKEPSIPKTTPKPN